MPQRRSWQGRLATITGLPVMVAFRVFEVGYGVIKNVFEVGYRVMNKKSLIKNSLPPTSTFRP